MKYKFLPHTADIKFQAFGDSLEMCFTNAGMALINIICKEKIKNKKKKIIKVKARDREGLLYNFLEEFLYFLEVGEFLIGEIKNLKIIGIPIYKGKKKFYNFELNAEVYGDDVKNYEPEQHVKAITYNSMFIREENSNEKRFTCQVVVDV